MTDFTSLYCCRPYSPISRPMPDCLKPPERGCRIEYVIAIDPHRARANVVGDRVSLADVAGPNGRRQTISSVVGALNDFVESR